jgi:diguanylate cyclase (GGDEF)-like protein
MREAEFNFSVQNLRQPTAVIGFVILLSALTVLAGWMLRLPALVRFEPGGIAMVFNSALCFALAGLALIFGDRSLRLSRRVDDIVAILILGLTLAVMGQSALGLDLGIDLPWLHRWIDGLNPLPGRMALITCIGFMLYSLILLLLDRSSSPILAGLLEFLAFGLILIGLVAIFSAWLDLGALYGWHSRAPIAISTAAGLTVLGSASWLRLRQRQFPLAKANRQEWELTLIAGEILGITALVGGMTIFAILQHSLEATFADNLEDNVAARSQNFDSIITDAMQLSAVLSTRPALAQQIDDTVQHGDETARAGLERATKTLLPYDYRHISFIGLAEQTLAASGERRAILDLAVRLNTVDDMWLAWSERGFVLVQHAPMTLEGRRVGSLVTERFLPRLTNAYHDVSRIGLTADTGICSRRDAAVICFPTRTRHQVFTIDGEPSAPIRRALAGHIGLVKDSDERGETVIVAHAPIGTLGLGLFMQIDLEELYAPIRQKLEIIAPLLLLLVVGGTLLLRLYITPLARKLREMATIDGLTEALNRSTFMRLAQAEFAIARRYRRPFTILMLDADHFKKVNDTYGHDGGDAVLRALAATCRQALRDVDLFGRLGGEEFAIAMPETPEDGGLRVAERLRTTLAGLAVACGGVRITFTVSMGLAAHHEKDLDALLKAADLALYQAKQTGRNRVAVALPTPTPAGDHIADAPVVSPA